MTNHMGRALRFIVATAIVILASCSVRGKATTSYVNGTGITPSSTMPTTIPFTANATIPMSSEVPTQDHGLSCICDQHFSQSCLDDPFCSLSGSFAHCIIEVSSPDMGVRFQGCNDLFVNFFSCDGEVIQHENGRLVLCCLTNNCNSVEAVMAQVSLTGAATPNAVLTTPQSFPTATLQATLSVLEESPNNSSLPMDVEEDSTVQLVYLAVPIAILAFIVLILVVFIIITLTVMGYVLVLKKVGATSPPKSVKEHATKSESC